MKNACLFIRACHYCIPYRFETSWANEISRRATLTHSQVVVAHLPELHALGELEKPLHVTDGTLPAAFCDCCSFATLCNQLKKFPSRPSGFHCRPSSHSPAYLVTR